MTVSPQVVDECRRLQALRSYAVLDTLPEEALDDLTALAAQICAAPVALISLIDEKRQWFKARVGTEVAETPLDLSFCVYALGQPGLFIVPDASRDERFASNPLVTGEPGICFYAGAPLVTPEGEALGTLCVIDYVPRTLTAAQEQALGVLSRQVMTHLELRRQRQELRASEGKLRAIFEAEPECVKLLGVDGTLREMNAAGLQIIEASTLEAVPKRNLLSLVEPRDCAAVRAMLAAAAQGEKRMVGFQLIGLAGTKRSIEMTGVPFRDVATGEDLVLGVSLDVTARKLAEFRLHRLNRLHTVLSKTGEAILRGSDRGELYDAVCRIAVADGLLRMAIVAEVDADTGQVRWAASHGEGQEYLRELAVSTNDGPLARGTIGTTLRTGKPDFCNDLAIDPRMAPWHKGAQKYGFRSTASFPLKRGPATMGALILLAGETGYFQDDEIRLMAAVADNLSFGLQAQEKEQSRRQAESACRASEQQFASAFAYAPIGVALVAPDGHFLKANRALEQMLGYSEVELLARRFQDITHPDDLEADLQNLRGLLAGEITSYQMEKRYIPRTGDFMWALLSVSMVCNEAGEVVHFIAQVQDITERKRTEAEMRRTTELLRGVADGTPDAVFVKDAQGRYLLFNVAAAQFVGRPSHEILGLDDRDLFGEESARAVMASDRLVMETNQPQTTEEILTAGGVTRTYMATKAPFRGSDGAVLGVIGISRDITERKKSEQHIAEQAALIDEVPDAITVRDLDHRVTFWSKGAERVYGWTAAEAAGQKISELLHTNPEILAAATETVLREGWWSGEVENIAKGGHRLTTTSRWTLLKGERDLPLSILAISTDITERKKLELQFLRAQRMESIGTLAGGIAHDLNNSLAPIIMSLELLSAKFTDHDSVKLLEILSNSALRGSDMVRQVLSFARGVEGERKEVQIRHLVREIEKIVNDTFLKNIQVTTRIPKDLWTVLGDSTQLHQVLLNLCVNARDAMPNGGALTISAENLVLDAHYAGLSWNDEAKPGPHVFMQVIDTGTGISPKVMEKIFDPFFTTKDLNKGTGLGLSTSLAIIKSHGGFMRVYSEQGKGTKFEVYLPALPGTGVGEAAEAVADMPRGHGELILVVDDELAVRQITDCTLKAFGYRVALAANGVEAVAIFAREGAEIAAVLTDMMMPEMDGPATIHILRRMNPTIPIIAASGLSSHDRVAALGVQCLLAKPYRAEALLKALHEALSPAGPVVGK